MSQSCHCRGGRSDVEISHKMFRIRRSLPKIRSDPARLPRPLRGLAMTSATFSTPRRKNEMYRPASRTVSLSKSPFGSFAKLPSKLQNVFCSSVLQFCRCGGLFDAKGHPDGFLSHFSSLRNLRLGSFFASPFRKNEMYRPASRTVHFVEKKERERKKRKSMKKRGGAIYGRHRIRAGDCPARTAPAHWPMLLALRSAPHRPCCQTRWAGGTSCRSARW